MTPPSLDEALARHRAGRTEEAIPLYRALLVAQADNADLHHLLALALSVTGPVEARPSETWTELRRAIALAPSAALYLHNAVSLSAGMDEDRLACLLARSLALAAADRPPAAETCYRLGALAARAKRWTRAGRFFRRALTLAPDLALALRDHGNLAIDTNRHPDAALAFQRLVHLTADSADAWRILGGLSVAAMRYRHAGACLRRALALDPVLIDAWRSLSMLLFTLGRIRTALAVCRRVLAFDPSEARTQYEFLPFLHLDPDLTPAAQLAFRRRAHRRLSDPLTRAAAPHRNDRDPERRLRIGFVDDRMLRRSTHVVFFMPLIEALDLRQVELYFYTNLPEAEADDMTRRYAAAATVFRHVGGMSDAALADRVRDDAIDILVDIIGHLTGIRAGLFARKPAPLQVIVAQVGSSGMAAMDYAVADPVLLPPGLPDHFSEKILRLPVGYLFEPVADLMPPVFMPPPEDPGRPVTFGSLNLLAKIDAPVLALWARVLARVPGSRLLLKAAGLADPATQRRIAGIMGDHGVDPARLDLRPWVRGQVAHLAVYDEIDIALDCFPYPGVTTSLEALLMGVPVVTLAGDRFVGRFGEAILTAIGHPEWIAPDQERYVAIAAGLAADPRLRRHLRGRLRQELLASPLCDPRSFAAALEDAFRRIWRDWCRGGEVGVEHVAAAHAGVEHAGVEHK
jgi:protein O-GlcNAc transferase